MQKKPSFFWRDNKTLEVDNWCAKKSFVSLYVLSVPVFYEIMKKWNFYWLKLNDVMILPYN